MRRHNFIPFLIVAFAAALAIWLSYPTSAAADDKIIVVAFKKMGENQFQYFSKAVAQRDQSWTSGPVVKHDAIVMSRPKMGMVVERKWSAEKPDAAITQDSYLQLRDLTGRQNRKLFILHSLKDAIAQSQPAIDAQGVREGSIGEIQLSPDLTAAAVTHHRLQDDSMDLWVVDVPTTKCTKISNGNNYDEMPAWSPDGTKLVFYRTPARVGHGWGATPEQRGYALWLWDRRTGVSKEIVPAGQFADLVHYPPVWSPDGSQILFNTGYDVMKGRFGVYIVGSDGKGLKCLSEQDTGSMITTYSYEFSPDGTKVLYTWSRRVCIMNADGTDRNVIFPQLYYEDAAWSSKGDLILLMTYPFSWFIAKPDGTDVQPIIPPAGYKIYKAFIVD